jgi:hypothetical protein
MHDAGPLAAVVERIDADDGDAARSLLGDLAIRAGPKVQLEPVAFEDAVAPRVDVARREVEVLAVEVGRLVQVEGAEDWGQADDARGLRHARSVPNAALATMGQAEIQALKPMARGVR